MYHRKLLPSHLKVSLGRFESEFMLIENNIYQERYSSRFYRVICASNMIITLALANYKGAVRPFRKSLEQTYIYNRHYMYL